MACPIITIDADFTQYFNPSEFPGSPAVDVNVSLSFDSVYSELSVVLSYDGQIFNGTTTNINTPPIQGANINDSVTLSISLLNSEGNVCEYNETFVAEQEIGQDIELQEVYYRTIFQANGIPQIEGCTDPTALNYNPVATISTDTCVYPDDDPDNPDTPDVPIIEQPTFIRYVEGCTNQLALNFNPLADINDGSCVFVSGCTLPFADNYNERAVVDDGSCVCNSYNILLDFSGSTDGYFIPTNSGSCTTVLSFDYLLELTCEQIFDIYLENTGSTLTDILDAFSLDFKVYSTDYEEIYSKNIWQHNFTDEQINLYIKSDDFCNLFYDKLREENGIACDIPIENKYKIFRSNQEFIIPNISGQNVLFTLQLKNISTEHCIILDNIRLTQFCENKTSECILIPKQFGFELEKHVDNVKTSLSPDEYLLNTKEITLRLNPINYINKDIVDYYNKNSFFLKEDKLYSLSLSEIERQLIDVRSRQTDREYIYHKFIYDNYINSMYSCSLTSKSLDYHYVEEVYDRIDPIWYDLTNQFIPATSIRKGGHYFYKNLIIHQPKYEYRGYTLDKGCEGDANASFEIITDDPCVKILTYKSRFEQVLQQNNLCDQCLSTGITYSYFDAGNNESGRLIQYSGDNVTNIIETVNFDTTTELISCDICAATVVINNAYIDNTILYVEFQANDVTLSDSIIASYGGLFMTLASYDEASGEGVFTLDKPNKTGQVIISVDTEDCGQASDTVDFDGCQPPSITIEDVYIENEILYVEIQTLNVTTDDQINGVYDGIPMLLDEFDNISGKGVFVLNKPNPSGQVFVGVLTAECGRDFDTLDFQRCEIVAEPALYFIDPLNPSLDVTYTFFVYGTTLVNDIEVLLNGVLVNNLQYIGNNQFSMDYQLSSGQDVIDITATMPCGVVSKTVINNLS